MLRTVRPSAIVQSVACAVLSRVCSHAVVETGGPPDALGLVGSTIDQVRFDACVDAGGFGLIYRGFHEGLGETVAIKCLRIASIQRTNEEMREALAGRFRDETKLLYRLSQGNLDIVRCISSGTLVAPRTREYTPYMVLEWLDGCTLSAELRERREHKFGGRSLEAAVNLLDSAVGGLAYAHSHEVVHRDVKPGNLFLTRTREGVRMKVLDFGLAKILDDEAIGIRPSVETGIGVHFCSPSYGAPEQYSPQIGKVGPWTDVYSLCLVLYEIMLGEKVRPASSLAAGLLMAIDPATGSPSASALGLSVRPAVEALLKSALAQNPLERPRDAGVFWGGLKAAMKASPRNLMGATVMDEGVNSAMQQIREAAVQRAAAAQPSPFTGTMLMENAPSAGAPHLGGTLPTPAPAAGRPPTPGTAMLPASRPAPSEGPPRTTAPLRPPVQSSQAQQLQMTMPIGSMSPLAASMAIQSPLRGTPASQPPPPHAGPSAPPPHQPPPPQQQQQQQTGPMPSRAAPPGPQPNPRAGDAPEPSFITGPPMSSSAGTLAAVVVLFVLAVMGGAFYWFRMRGH